MKMIILLKKLTDETIWNKYIIQYTYYIIDRVLPICKRQVVILCLVMNNK